MSDRRDESLRLAGLSELSHEEQRPGEMFVAVVEGVINQTLLASDFSKKYKLQE